MLGASASLPLLPFHSKISVNVFLKAFLCLRHQLPTTTAPFLFLPLSLSPALPPSSPLHPSLSLSIARSIIRPLTRSKVERLPLKHGVMAEINPSAPNSPHLLALREGE